jgi:hypothetical protein
MFLATAFGFTMKILKSMFLVMQLSSLAIIGSSMVGCGSGDSSTVVTSEKTREQLQQEADAQVEMAKQEPNT